MCEDTYRPIIRADLQYRELADGGVIYDTTAERIHTLNVAAAYIWNSCDGFHNLSEIASELYQQGNVPSEQAAKDVSDTVTYFQDEGLLRVQ